MRAHELVSILLPDSEDYNDVMAAAKFDLGDVDNAMALADASSKTFFRLPAPICLFQVETGPGELHLYLAHTIEEIVATNGEPLGDGFTLRLFIREPGYWSRSTVQTFFYSDGRGMFVNRLGEHSIVDKSTLVPDEIKAIQCQVDVATAIEVFSCCNVATVEHKPPRFINAKRIAKGKAPFFSYRTLHITSDAAPKKGEAATGTHASPRLHLRRGHIRRLPDDRRIWVRASLVGDKSKGFAAKDYSVGRVANNLPATIQK